MRRTLPAALVLVTAALLAAAAMAGTVKHPSELRYPDLEIEPLDYEEISLENGMRGFFVEDHEVPVVDIYILIPVSRPAKEKTGLAELTGWTLRNGGTETWPAERINEELEFVDASIEINRAGGMMSRGGGLPAGRAATVHVNCLKKDLDLCLEILGDLMANPTFPDEQLELRKSTMIEDLRRSKDNMRSTAVRELRKALYGDHPMAWHATVASVEGITRDDLVSFHERYYRPNTAIVGITGDVERDEIIDALDEALAGWEPADVVLTPEPEIEPEYEPRVHYIEKADMNQGVVLIGHMGINSSDGDRIPVSVMNFILGGGSFTSRITQRVRTDEGLAYAAYSRYGHDPFCRGLFYASSQTRADAVGRATTLMLDLIREMHEQGPTEEEFERARESYLNNYVFEYDSKSAVVRRLVQLEWQGRPLDTPERDLEAMRELTLEDVREAAAEHLHPDGLTILVAGNQETFDQPLSNFGEVETVDLDAAIEGI